MCLHKSPVFWMIRCHLRHIVQYIVEGFRISDGDKIVSVLWPHLVEYPYCSFKIAAARRLLRLDFHSRLWRKSRWTVHAHVNASRARLHYALSFSKTSLRALSMEKRARITGKTSVWQLFVVTKYSNIFNSIKLEIFPALIISVSLSRPL